MKIEEATPTTILDLWTRIEPDIRGSPTLEAAAQTLVTALYEDYADSIVLVRTFLTLPLSTLPARNQAFVRKLAGEGASELEPHTAVLSLIGSRGQERQWNDRRTSEGHVGIPFISSAFVEAIPMISRLLKELRVPLEWVDTRDTDIVEKLGSSTGLFFVENAVEATDQDGRKIIAAQDFVAKYGVTSVFGLGGAYFGDHMLVTVVFCRDLVPRASAEQFAPFLYFFKAGTTGLLEDGRVFADA